MSRNVWAYDSKECRLYCFNTKADRTAYINKGMSDVEAIDAAGTVAQDFRCYAAKWGYSEAVEEYISPNSPIRSFCTN
jgi:hypothetical protein